MQSLAVDLSLKRLREEFEGDDSLSQLHRVNAPFADDHLIDPYLNLDYVADIRQELLQVDEQGEELLDEQEGDHDGEEDDDEGEHTAVQQGPDFDAKLLQLTGYHDLIKRKRILLPLLVAQGAVPSLQTQSAAAIEAMIQQKAPSWQQLLRRSLVLFSTFCTENHLPTFPITSPKVALYLCRLGGDDNLGEGDNVASGSDLNVPGDSSLDPSLVGHSIAYPPLPKPKMGKDGLPRPKKILRRKTLEQYVNRLTTLRAPTLSIWRNRSGEEGIGTSGLGVCPVIKNIFERAAGEGSKEVKKKSRTLRNGTNKGLIKVKKVYKGKERAYDDEDGEDSNEGDLEVGGEGGGEGTEGDGMIDPQLDDEGLGDINHFLVMSDSNHNSFELLIDPALGSVSQYLPDPMDLGVSHSGLLLAPGTGVGETYTLSEDDFVVAMNYIKSLQARGIEQRIGDITRSVEVATGVGMFGNEGDELIDPSLE